MLGIVGSETLVFLGFTRFALGGHVVTLLLCSLGPLRMKEEVVVFQSFALIPVFRIVNLTMPVFFEFTLFWFPLIYGPFLPAVLVVAWSNPSVDLSAGWIAGIGTLPIAISLGAIIGEIGYVILKPPTLIPVWEMAEIVVLIVVMGGLVGLVEELIFRVILQSTLQKRLGRVRGLLLASLTFGLMHSGFASIPMLVFAFGAGLFYGILYDRTRSILLVMIIHGTANVFLFGLLPLNGPFLSLLLSGLV